MLNKKKIIIGTAQLFQNYGISNSILEYKKDIQEDFLIKLINNGYRKFDTSLSYKKSFSFFLDVISKKNIEDIEINIKVFENEINFLDDILNNLKDKNIKFVISAYNLETFKSKSFQNLLYFKKKNFYKGISIYEDEIDKLIDLKIIPPCIQLPLNILNFDEELHKKILKFKKKNITLNARSIFLQGLLYLNLNDIKKTKKFDDLEKYFKCCSEVLGKSLYKIGDLSLSFINNNRNIDNLILGFESYSQIEHMEYLFKFPPPESLMIQIRELSNYFPKIRKDPRNW